MTTRETLIHAATELLDHGGVDGVTLREVGHRAGVSHNAPYKHFADKEALLAAVAAQELRETGRILERASEGSGLEPGLEAVVAQALRYPHRFRLVYGGWSDEPAELVAAATAAWQALVDAVAHAQDGGQLPAGEPGRLAEMIRVVIHGAVDLALAGHLAKSQTGGRTPEEILRAHLELLRGAIATP